MRTLGRAWPSIVVSPFVVWLVVRFFGLERGGLPVQLVSFTPYVAAAAALVLVVTLATRRWWAAGVVGLVAAALVALVLPRALGGPTPIDGEPLRVASVNLRIGGADAQAIVALVREREVDVLALQEVTGASLRALEQAGLDAVLPFHQAQADDLAAGTAIFSRVEPTEAGVRPEESGRFAQAYLRVRGVMIESVHPLPPLTGAVVTRWERGLRSEPPASEGRVLVGDFNATLDHAELRRLIATGYRDAADEVGAGLTPTWPFAGSRSAVTPKVAIDHVLVPAGIGVRDFAAVTIPHTDHRAIIATLVVTG